METKILIFSFLALLISEITSQNTVCEQGWNNYDGNCYKIFHRNRQGLEAQQSCLSEGGNLLKISNWTHWLWIQTMSQSDSDASRMGSSIYVKLFVTRIFYWWNYNYKHPYKVGAYSAYYKKFYWISDGSSLSNNYWCNATCKFIY